MKASRAFPKLTDDNHRETSSAAGYNCIAWAAGDTEHWWQPGMYWQPTDWPRDEVGLNALEPAFRLLGYEECLSADLEPGYLKVAFYGSGFLYTHAARHLPDGKWTSKLGKDIDIEYNDPEVLEGPLYGVVYQYMRRAAQ